jgi:hypothetical protein
MATSNSARESRLPESRPSLWYVTYHFWRVIFIAFFVTVRPNRSVGIQQMRHSQVSVKRDFDTDRDWYGNTV